MKPFQVAVLARAAEPGSAKTRLIPMLGPAGAAALQSQLTQRALRRAAGACASVVLWIDGEADEPVRQLANRLGVEMRRQPKGDLGSRMLAALSSAAEHGFTGIVIGTDCPAQSSADLCMAAVWLADHDVVLQPAHDGGYVLIGMRQPQRELFDGIAWGTNAVLSTTRARIAGLGLRCAELPALPDLDRPDDVVQALERGWIDLGASA